MPDIFEQVQEHAVRRQAWANARTTNLYIQREVLKAGSVVMAHRQEIPLKQDIVLVFADDAPQFNWSHPCRYLLYDARSGEPYQEVGAEFPPYLTKVPDSFVVFHEPVRLVGSQFLYPIRPIFWCPLRFPRGQRYAVLFAGASNNRHTNDLEFLYRTLRDLYGFRDDNIYCLNYDGTINYSGGPQPVVNWPGDNTRYRMPVKGAGTKAALEGVFDELKGKLKPEDFLLIHTNNHGGYNGPGQAYLVTYSGPDYFAADFAAKVGQLPIHYCMMVMMEQCHAGGFNAPILAQSKANYTTVSSACLEPNNSIGGPEYDPFARDWIAAMAGHTPNGGALAFNPDANSNGRVSAREAHDYANAVHDPYDTPTYSENTAAAGDTFLAQRYVWWWWHWCVDLRKILYPYYLKLPVPEFYERLNTRLGPQLQELDDSLEKAVRTQQRQLSGRLEKSVKEAFE
jgi:hypothetical protein